MSFKSNQQQPETTVHISDSTSTIELAKFYELKMPEVKLTRLDPNAETAAKQVKTKRSRSKQKTTEVVIEEKKTGSRTPRRARSSSKPRSNSRKRTEVKGAKLYTKKDLEQAETVTEVGSVRAAKRSLRSSSSTSTKITTKTDLDVKSLDDSLVKEKDLLNDIDSVSVIGQTLDSSIDQPRYSLRKRASPPEAEKQTKADELNQSQPLVASSNESTTVQATTSISRCPLFTCGYLNYSRKQIINCIIVSILMIVALAVINYLNEYSFENLKNIVVETKDKVVNVLSGVYDALRYRVGLN